MKDLKEFLPEVPKPGFRGFYPCANTEEWRQLPLPLKCITWNKPVEYVVFDIWLDNYKIKATANVHRQDVHKALFCDSDGGTQLYSVVGVIYRDGTKRSAKWLQDTRTGAFAIVNQYGEKLGVQGGFEGFMPEICYKDESGDWKVDFQRNSEGRISHAAF